MGVINNQGTIGGGIASLREGLQLIQQPGLRRFVWVPLLVNILFLGLSLYLLTAWFDTWLDGWLATLPTWLAWLEGFFWLLFSLLALLLVFFGFSLLANLILAPFNGLLAEAVENHLRGLPIPSPSVANMLRQLPGILLDELGKLIYFAGLALLVLILSWIPLLNLLAPLAWFALAAWVMVVQYADYPMGNHEMRFGPQRRLLRRLPMASLGFGSATALLTMIPLLNFVVIPTAVAGATVLWYRHLQPKMEPGS